MSDDRTAGYAAGLLEIARAEGALDRVGDELFRIARSFESSAELRDALTDVRLPTQRKLAIVGDLLGERTSEVSVALVNFVVGMGRAKDLPAIADGIVERIAEERERTVAEVRSAVPLGAESVERLRTALSEATGKRVDVKVVVDETVLGGIVARVGDTVIDGSMRRRLESLRRSMLTNVGE